MINHFRTYRADLLPEHVSVHRKSSNIGSSEPSDPMLMRDIAEQLVLGGLQPVRTVDDKYFRQTFSSRLKGLGHKTALQREVDANVADVRREVQELVPAVKASGGKVVLSGDCWKPKMKLRRHYLAVLLDFALDWQHRTVCACLPHALYSSANF